MAFFQLSYHVKIYLIEFYSNNQPANVVLCLSDEANTLVSHYIELIPEKAYFNIQNSYSVQTAGGVLECEYKTNLNNFTVTIPTDCNWVRLVNITQNKIQFFIDENPELFTRRTNIIISNNEINSIVYAKIEVLQRGLQNTTYVGDIDFFTQEEVDNFAAQNYSIITGNLLFTGPDIINIPDFSFLTTINGCIKFNTCTAINNIQGFNDLTTLNGGIEIFNCPNLTEITGFNSLIVIDGSNYSYGGIHIQDCNSLKKISTFNSLKTLASVIYLEGNLKSLETIDGFTNLNTVSSWISIRGTDKLVNLSGLSNLKNVGSEISIDAGIKNLSFLSNIQTLEALNLKCPNLETMSHISNMNIERWLSLSNCIKLNDLNLKKIPKQWEGLYLKNCNSLKSADNLKELYSIGRLEISGALPQAVIEGLSNLKIVRQRLALENISSLYNLNFLSAIVSIGAESGFNQRLVIKDNINLTDFSGIKNAISPSLNALITGNAYNPTIADIINGKTSQTN